MFSLKIDTDNAAFCSDDVTDDSQCRAEVARILENIAGQIENGSEDQSGVYDINGNRVGKRSLQP